VVEDEQLHTSVKGLIGGKTAPHLGPKKKQQKQLKQLRGLSTH
jgi:hypothetical protein